MKCPRCGAFMDNNKTICFMCGATLNNNTDVNTSSNLNSDDNQNFNGFNNTNPFANSFEENSVNSSSSVSNDFNTGLNGFDNFSMNNSFNNPSMNNNTNNGNFNNSSMNNNSNSGNFNNFANTNFDNQNSSGFNNPKVEDSKPVEDLNNKIFNRREEIKANDDYKNIKLEDIKTDKDIFDFFSEHKKGIKIFFLILLFAGIGFGVFMFVKSKMSPKVNDPIIGNLYYEIDDGFDLIQNSSSQYVYSLSGAKGSDCSITISSGTTTSGNHVLDYFNENVNKFAPSKDRDGNILNPLDEFKSETSEVEINEHLWSRQYFYYRPDLSSIEYTLLKKMFLSSMYKGFYYDIELVNNTNSTTCNVELDSFINSLEFVNVDKK